jgi:hypothetical protein
VDWIPWRELLGSGFALLATLEYSPSPHAAR